MEKNIKEIVTGSAFALAGRLVAVSLAIITNIIVARYYGASTLGNLAIVNSSMIFITIFTLLGTNTSVLRLLPEHETKYSLSSAFRVYNSIQSFVIGFSIIMGVVLFFSSSLVANNIFSKPHLTNIFQLMSLFLVFKSLTILTTQAVRGLQLIKAFAFMQALPSFSMLLVLCVTSYISNNPNNPIYSQFGALCITSIIGFWVIYKSFNSRIFRDDYIYPITFKQIISISSPMLMTYSMQFLLSQTGIVIISIFYSEDKVGLYSVAVKLAMLTTFVLQAINSIAAPKFSELYHSKKISELFYVATKSAKIIFWATTPILIALIVFGKQILLLVYGKEFLAAYNAMTILVAGQFINSISGATANFMNMTGHQREFRNIIFISSIINVSLGLFLIPALNIVGAAIAGAISLSFWNLYTLYYINKKYNNTTGYFPIYRKIKKH